MHPSVSCSITSLTQRELPNQPCNIDMGSGFKQLVHEKKPSWLRKPWRLCKAWGHRFNHPSVVFSSGAHDMQQRECWTLITDSLIDRISDAHPPECTVLQSLVKRLDHLLIRAFHHWLLFTEWKHRASKVCLRNVQIWISGSIWYLFNDTPYHALQPYIDGANTAQPGTKRFVH